MHSMTSVIAKAVFNPETCDVQPGRQPHGHQLGHQRLVFGHALQDAAQKQGTLTVTDVLSVLCLPEGTCAMSGAGADGGG